MPLVVKDRVKVTSTTAGTGTLTLGAASFGFQDFSVVGDGNTTYYAVVDTETGDWEVGIGTYTSSGTTLSRATILESSTGGTAVNFAANPKDVFVTYPAERSVYLDETGNLSITTPTVISTNSTSDALRITQVGTGNCLVVEDSANPDATPFVITKDGDVILGGTVAIPSFQYNNPQLFIFGGSAGGQKAGQYTVVFSNDTAGASVELGKSRSATIGTVGTIVQSGDELGIISFNGDDGTDLRTSGASIRAFVDGTPGTNDMPGRLVFSTTADGASTPTERMRIDNAGRVGIGGTAPAGSGLLVANNLTGSATGQSVRIAGQLIQSDVTSEARAVISLLGTASAAFTLGNLQHFFAGQGTFGAGSTVTNQYGFFAQSSLTGATNNYGFYSNIASGTGRFNFYANGTAANFFEGTTHIGGLGAGKLNVATGSGTETALYLYQSGVYNASIRIPASTAAMSFFADTTERMRIASTGTISLGAAPGAESLRVTPVASAVNFVQVQGGVTGLPALFAAQGSDTNVSLQYLSKGTGNHNFGTAGGTAQFLITHTASAVNFLQVTGGGTGTGARIFSQGSDANVTLDYVTKGTSPHNFYTGATSAVQFRITNTASAVNFLSLTGSATGNAATLSAAGSDTNIDIALTPKGTGVVRDANGNIRAVPKSGASKTSSYSLVKADVGQFIEIGTGGSITIPDATFATGDILSLFNNTTGDITVTCTITTAYIGGTDTNKATVTLATRGVATILFISGTVCVINGNVT
jgi:hypothetical protein